jgi:cobalt-zinc-cadmium resistance protein CzcA
VVVGTALMLIGENSRTVAQRAEKRLAEVSRSLPAGVVAREVYSRSNLVNATLDTVRSNLVDGRVAGDRGASATARQLHGRPHRRVVIPLALLFAIAGMATWGISANLLSLGAIDFGIIVDGAVVMMETS